MFLSQKSNTATERNYLKTSADVEQALNAIKIVKAFGQESYEFSTYEKHLRADERNQKKNAFMYGVSLGLLEAIQYI